MRSLTYIFYFWHLPWSYLLLGDTETRECHERDPRFIFGFGNLNYQMSIVFILFFFQSWGSCGGFATRKLGLFPDTLCLSVFIVCHLVFFTIKDIIDKRIKKCKVYVQKGLFFCFSVYLTDITRLGHKEIIEAKKYQTSTRKVNPYPSHVVLHFMFFSGCVVW